MPDNAKASWKHYLAIVASAIAVVWLFGILAGDLPKNSDEMAGYLGRVVGLSFIPVIVMYYNRVCAWVALVLISLAVSQGTFHWL